MLGNPLNVGKSFECWEILSPKLNRESKIKQVNLKRITKDRKVPGKKYFNEYFGRK